MAAEDWIDAVADVFAIAGHNGQRVKSYHVYDKAEFPEAITVWPCALTFTVSCLPEYSLGGPLIDHWWGVTELHLFDDISRGRYPELMLYFARIRNAMASSMTLGGRVKHFSPRSDLRDPLRGPVVLQYGSDNPHLGIIAQWEVKDDEGGKFTPAL